MLGEETQTVRELSLGSLEEHVQQLLRRVADAGFAVEVIVFIERAGRIPAIMAARHLKCTLVPLYIQRSTTPWKTKFAFALRFIPRWLYGPLRRAEAKLTFQKRRDCCVVSPHPANLVNRNILILDDAADTGSSVLQARKWVITQGASPARVRTSTLTVTTDLAEAAVDFRLFRGICRFPWSSDSDELQQFGLVYRELEKELNSRLQ